MFSTPMHTYALHNYYDSGLYSGFYSRAIYSPIVYNITIFILYYYDSASSSRTEKTIFRANCSPKSTTRCIVRVHRAIIHCTYSALHESVTLINLYRRRTDWRGRWITMFTPRPLSNKSAVKIWSRGDSDFFSQLSRAMISVHRAWKQSFPETGSVLQRYCKTRTTTCYLVANV